MKISGQFLYGRARRLELIKKITIVVVIVVVLGLGIFFFSKKVVKTKVNNSKFADLTSYLESFGYRCESLENSGGSCFLTRKDTDYLFVRSNSGFKYSFRGTSYNIEIIHDKELGDSIVFRTNREALDKYKSLYYTCSTDNSVIGKLQNCITDDGRVLDLDVYIGIVEKEIYNLNNILKASKMNMDKLINDYEWEKK